MTASGYMAAAVQVPTPVGPLNKAIIHCIFFGTFKTGYKRSATASATAYKTVLDVLLR